MSKKIVTLLDGTTMEVDSAVTMTLRDFLAPGIHNLRMCFGNIEGAQLDGNTVDAIHADLTAGEGLNLTQAKQLEENADVAFIGTQKNGPFDVSGDIARQWLKLPNPNGRPNSDVLRPWANGLDVTRRPQDRWVVDFGCDLPLNDAALFEVPFAHVNQVVKRTRTNVRRDWHRTHWWLYGDARPGLREKLSTLRRFIATAMVSKHRVFVWLPTCQIPENLCVAIARSDDVTFGVLHSRFHELWALRMGTSLEDRPRYTPTTTFETFPFPEGLTPDLIPLNFSNPEADHIATAAQALNALRDNWLNPPEWTDWVRTPEEEAADYPSRPVAKSGHEADLKKRTLTNLYNARPAWLDNAHKTLDAAVAKAYGWPDYTPDMPDKEILRRLLALNLERAARQV